MLQELKSALLVLLVLTVVTGVAYPLVVTGVALAVFPGEARGSVIHVDGRAVGSELIGQPFDDPQYFWGRLSATGPFPYNAAASSGSNLGPTNPARAEARAGREAALAEAGTEGAAPVDLVTASGSGLDPHISPAAAELQVARVARARGLDEDAVRRLVAEHTEGRDLGFLGEPRVNVLLLNLALTRADTRKD